VKRCNGKGTERVYVEVRKASPFHTGGVGCRSLGKRRVAVSESPLLNAEAQLETTTPSSNGWTRGGEPNRGTPRKPAPF
jgi:hypothetical protein